MKSQESTHIGSRRAIPYHIAALVSAVILATAETTLANPIGTILEYDLFGHLSQGTNPWCASTATINSFNYLWKKYPSVYQSTSLLTDYDGGGISNNDLSKDRDFLRLGWQNSLGVTRQGMGADGATYQSMWEAKVWWFADWAPGTTLLKGMIGSTEANPSGWTSGSLLQNQRPTFDWLLAELQHGEDIELILLFTNGSKHAVTLGGLQFEDTGDGKWQPGAESAQVFWLEPNKPTNGFLSTEICYSQQNNTLSFDWGAALNPGTSKLGSIVGAYSESVPEPTFSMVIGIGVVVLVISRRKKIGLG